MPTPARTRRRLRAAAVLAGASALATAAAVAPTDPTPDPSAAPGDAQVALDPEVSPTIDSAPLSEQVLIAASVDEVQTAPEPVETAAAGEAAVAPEPEPEPEPVAARSVWDQLADCESGEWTGDGGFVTASANWSATAGLFEGGLQFHPDTWDGYRDPGMPGAAYDASRAQQIEIAERVLAEQGWKAWPVCSRKLGLR